MEESLNGKDCLMYLKFQAVDLMRQRLAINIFEPKKKYMQVHVN